MSHAPAPALRDVAMSRRAVEGMITALGWTCWNAPLSALLDQAVAEAGE